MGNVELETLVPANEGEKHEAATAILRQRRRDEDARLVKSLTRRERLLIEHAWELGAKTEQKRLRDELANPQAVTLDAASVRATIERVSRAPILDVEPWWPPGREWGYAYDEQITKMIRRVVRLLEMEERDVR